MVLTKFGLELGCQRISQKVNPQCWIRVLMLYPQPEELYVLDVLVCPYWGLCPGRHVSQDVHYPHLKLYATHLGLNNFFLTCMVLLTVCTHGHTTQIVAIYHAHGLFS